MPDLFAPPTNARLPLSLGRDVVVTFRNQVVGSDPVQYVNYPSNVSVKLVIGKGASAVEGVGTISGSNAMCRIESDVVDGIRAGTLWRVVVSVDEGEYSHDEVPLNGKVVRVDGA